MVHFHSSCKISGQTDKITRNESKYKISSENYWDFTLYFHLYFKIWHFFHIPQFWQRNILVTLKAKYQNVPIISEFWHMSWGHRKPCGQFNKQKLLGRSLWNTLYFVCYAMFSPGPFKVFLLHHWKKENKLKCKILIYCVICCFLFYIMQNNGVMGSN